MSAEIRGVLPVMHTPFDEHDRIDLSSLQAEVDWAFEIGCNGICAAMVSEVLRLTIDERIALAKHLVDMAAGRGPVISSVGAEATSTAVYLAREAERVGCAAVMAIPPISSVLPEEAIWNYFVEIAEQVDLPLIVQDASSYVGGGMSIELFVRLLDRFGEEKILFKPEAAPVGPNLSSLHTQSAGRARIFDGSGGILLIDAFRRGIAGTIPGTDLLDGVVALWKALEAGRYETAYRVYFPMCAIVALQMQAGLDGFMAIEKHLMVRRGLFASAARRRPYAWELDDETRDEVDRLFDMLQDTLRNDPASTDR